MVRHLLFINSATLKGLGRNVLQAKTSAITPSNNVMNEELSHFGTSDLFDEVKGLEILSCPAPPLRNEHIEDRLESS